MGFARLRIIRLCIASLQAANADLAQAALTLFKHQIPGQRADAFNGDLRPRRQDLLPVGLGAIRHRRFHHAKCFRAVVGADEERIAVMRQIVLDAQRARQGYTKVSFGLIRPKIADLGGE